jgi:2-keto-4-pentenoate hydratase
MAIQNIGPDPLRVGYANVAADTGLHLTAGAVVIVGSTGSDIWAMSSATSCDVRILGGAIGFSGP